MRDALRKWSIHEQLKLLQVLPGCRQSKEMLRKPPDTRLSKYVLALSPRPKLRILLGLLNSHADFRPLSSLYHEKLVSNVELCPFYQEEESTSIHFITKCIVTTNAQRDISGLHILNYNNLVE